MSSSASPESYDQPSFFRRYGCLIFLVAFALLIVGGFLFARYMIVSTPMPFRMVARMIEKANPNVRIEGISGDLKTGVSVSSITWGTVPGKPSEILDLRIRYNGYGDMSQTHRLVIHEVGVRRAHIDLADLPSADAAITQTTVTSYSTTSSTTTSGSTTATTPPSGPTTSTTTTSSADGPVTTTTTTTSFTMPTLPGAPLPNGLQAFEIERMSIEDVLITNRNSPDFRLSIPKVEWTGFKATPTSLDPGALTVESDRLMLHTEPGRTVQVDGQSIAFQKLLKGTAQPALHPAIKQPISFTADLSFQPQGDAGPFHFVFADGNLEINGTANGGGSIHARQVDLASFLDPKKIFGEQTADLPGDLVLDAVAGPGFATGNGTMKITGGSFRLGVATFQIQPLEFTKAGLSGAVFQAVFKTDAGDILWQLPLARFGDEYHPRLMSQGMATTEILSRVFAGRPYEQLTAEEKKAIDARVPVYEKPVYFPPPLEK